MPTVKQPVHPGDVFGRLVVLSAVHRGYTNSHWRCRCACGRQRVVVHASLVGGRTNSCGCLRREVTGARAATHRLTGTPEYMAWQEMLRRCHDPGRPGYVNYGGRGITVCAAWDDFPAFLAAIGPRPSARHSLERDDVNGNYEPGNVRWATRTEQARNTRRNRKITYGGVTRILTDWASVTGLTVGSIHARLELGWTVEQALTLPKYAQRAH